MVDDARLWSLDITKPPSVCRFWVAANVVVLWSVADPCPVLVNTKSEECTVATLVTLRTEAVVLH